MCFSLVDSRSGFVWVQTASKDEVNCVSCCSDMVYITSAAFGEKSGRSGHTKAEWLGFTGLIWLVRTHDECSTCNILCFIIWRRLLLMTHIWLDVKETRARPLVQLVHQRHDARCKHYEFLTTLWHFVSVALLDVLDRGQGAESG